MQGERVFDLEAFASAVRERRRAASDVRSAAKECGVPATTLLRIEDGQNPTAEYAARLCLWMKRPFQDFMRKT